MARQSAMRDLVNHPGDTLLGKFRRFGEHGVAYEVIGSEDVDHVRIRVVESGETLRYPIRDARTDPEA